MHVYIFFYSKKLYSPYQKFCSMIVWLKGCPEPGFYGIDCSFPCPDHHCRFCHMETGTCQGCEPGYEGHHCELGNINYNVF